MAMMDALRRNPSHPLGPAIVRAYRRKPKQFGGWSTNARGKKNVKRRR